MREVTLISSGQIPSRQERGKRIMVFDHEEYISKLLERLDDAFGDRILFVGHIGSYARGEATEDSDVDINIVLDSLTMEDLGTYRSIVSSMPHSEKACGFICGREEIEAWPAHELFQFTQGCLVLRGSLDGLVAAVTHDDIRDSVRNIASSIYHQCCHNYIFGDNLAEGADGLRNAYKETFLVFQEAVYLRERVYVPTKKEMIGHLDGDDLEVLAICMRWSDRADDRRADPEHYFRLLKEWSSRMMRQIRTDELAV